MTLNEWKFRQHIGDTQKEGGNLAKALCAILVFSIVLVVCCFFSSCSTPKTITVTEYRDRVQIDTVTVERERVDSTYQAHYLYHQGDTVHQVDTIYKYRLKYVDKVQTQYERVHDSIPYQVEVIKEVRRRNGYDKFTSWGFWLLASLFLLWVLWRIRKY